MNQQIQNTEIISTTYISTNKRSILYSLWSMPGKLIWICKNQKLFENKSLIQASPNEIKENRKSCTVTSLMQA
jgi:hypothetical protein